jgi:hypothetical protein
MKYILKVREFAFGRSCNLVDMFLIAALYFALISLSTVSSALSTGKNPQVSLSTLAADLD